MTNTQATFAKAPERAPLEAITEPIFETSRLSDCNSVVARTAETAEALLAVLTGKCLLRGAR
jgi:hypothetical protein